MYRIVYDNWCIVQVVYYVDDCNKRNLIFALPENNLDFY